MAKPKAAKEPATSIAEGESAVDGKTADVGASVLPDWVRIELDYGAGIKTLRQIAGEHGLTEGAIRKRARRDDWTRDLSERIHAKAEQLVRKEAVRDEVRKERAASEKQVVDANAVQIAHIRLAHRKDAQRARRITNALLDELEQHTDPETLDILSDLGDLMRQPDASGQDKLNDLYQKVISLPERSRTLKTLAESLQKIVDIERTAFGMNAKEEGAGDALKDLLHSIAKANNSSIQPVDADPMHGG